jgi:drug/metabolite transporter (DMT)-like permease
MIRMSEAPPLVIATYRLTLATLIVAPFYIKSGGLAGLMSIQLIDLLTLAGVGVALALHFASWITSLDYTSVASAVIFGHIDPIFVAAVSHFVLGEKVRGGTILGIIVAFIGVAVIAFSDSGSGGSNLYGDLLALVGALMLGVYTLSGRRLRQSLDLASYVTPVYATAASVLAISCVVTGTKLWPYPVEEYVLFLAIAIIPMIFGHTVYNWTLKYIEASVASLSLLGEPVGATLLAYFFLGETPSYLTIVGGTITLLGIYLCVRNVSNN